MLKMTLRVFLAIIVVIITVILIFPHLLHERLLNSFTFHLVDWGYPTATVSHSDPRRPGFVVPLKDPVIKLDLEYTVDANLIASRIFLHATTGQGFFLKKRKTLWVCKTL